MLTDTTCRNATCPPDKTRKRLADVGGLYIEVSPSGSKRWFAKYRFGGKEKRLALGSYPDVSLKAAREGRDLARKVREGGSDPVQVRQAEKIAKAATGATTFEAVAREFHTVKSSGWSDGHATKWLRMNEIYLFPHIGSLPLSKIKTPSLLATIRKAEAKGVLSTAQDLQQMAGQVFRYGIQTGKCEHNPAGDLKGALMPHVAKHFSAVLDPLEAGGLLRAIDGYTGQPATVAAMQLSALFFQRPGNIRAMEWAWVDLEGAMLTIPPSDMKRKKHEKVNGKPHLVPLPALVRRCAVAPGADRGMAVIAMSKPTEQFRSAIQVAGLMPPDEIYSDGALYRFSTNGNAKDDAGWYVLHGDGIPAGAFGCWRAGVTQQWCGKSTDTMTQAERDTHRQRVEAMRQTREADTALRHQQAAMKAAVRWKAASTVTTHPYLTAKGVQAYGAKTDGEALLIPMRDVLGTLHGLQVIDAEGGKRFQPGGRVKGCYHAIGNVTF